MNFLTFQNLPTIMALAGWGAAGTLVLLGMFGASTRNRRKESDELADGLIARLQTTVNQNAEDLTAANRRIDIQQKEIHLLQGQNDAYLKILTLRDPQTAKVFEMAPRAFEMAEATHQLLSKHEATTENLTQKLTEFIAILQPILINLEQKTPA